MSEGDASAVHYRTLEELASGGTSRVRVGVFDGELGFSRLVAIKTLHERLAGSPEFAAMIVDEARLTMRVRHTNVVSVLDVVRDGDRLQLVMDYVPGLSLAALVARAADQRAPPGAAVASAIMCDALRGLHAAHAATDARGAPLEIVHRDVSPQNVLVGTDGVARVIDFGVAKARQRVQETRTGVIKGKLAYTAPEVLEGDAPSVRSDVYAAGVILWELVTSRRLYAGDDDAALVAQIRMGLVEPPSAHAAQNERLASSVAAALDEVALRALSADPAERFASAREMLAALEVAAPPASAREVSEWVRALAGAELDARAERLARLARAACKNEAPTARAVGVRALLARARPVRPAAAATAALAIALVAIPLAATRARHASSAALAEPRAALAASAPSDAPVAEPAPSDAPAARDPLARRESDDAPSAPAEPPARAAPRHLAPRAPAAPEKTAAARPKEDCTIPFRIGPDRRKIYKPECLDAR